MPSQVCCGTRMDGSGPGTASSSPNRRIQGEIDRLSPAPAPHDDRTTLPAGHPPSWGLLTAGTVLAGSAYADLH